MTGSNNGLSTIPLRSGKPRPRRSRKKFKEEVDQGTPAYILESMSSKDRLLAIIAAEKASETALKASNKHASEARKATAALEETAYEDKVSCASTETTVSDEQHGSLLQRGVGTLRRSFRKAIPKKNR